MSHVKLIFWDLGGQQELRSLWDKVWLLSYNHNAIFNGFKKIIFKSRIMYSQLFLNSSIRQTSR